MGVDSIFPYTNLKKHITPFELSNTIVASLAPCKLL